jgi:hypothetical protein
VLGHGGFWYVFINVFEESVKDKHRGNIFIFNVGVYLAESSMSYRPVEM